MFEHKEPVAPTRTVGGQRPKTMASAIKAILSSARESLSGASTPAPGTPPNATSIDELFPKVNPAIDGDGCDHDCETCEVKLPNFWKINEDDDLYGYVKGWSTHVLVATGKTDWVRDVKDEKKSVMEAFGKSGVKPRNGRLMLSASNIRTPSGHEGYSEPTSVLLLPAFVVIENVTPELVPELITTYIDNAPTTTTPIKPDGIPRSLPAPLPTAPQMTSRPSPHSALILLCSQKTRDARCGKSAPLIRKELERHLRPLGLFRDLDDERPGGVGIYFISHVGGHKYSANVMVYRRPDAFGMDKLQRAKLAGEVCPMPSTKVADDQEKGAAQCLWLARIRPEDCEGIVKFTVLQGKVVKPEQQLRGGFDRERGVFSW